MFVINKDRFFEILTTMNKTCMFRDIKDKYIKDVPKLKEIFEFVDLNKYDLEYCQNRLVAIKDKTTPINFIRNLIICPFDTEFVLQSEECENITYEFPSTLRKSYLTTGNTGGENESLCIKGYMNPSILNSILLYMLDTNLIPSDTMVIFSLKANTTKFDADDIIEYLQVKGLNDVNKGIVNVINLNYTSLDKGYPKKDFAGKIVIQSDDPSFANYALRKFNIDQNFDKTLINNFETFVKPMPKIKDNYLKLLQYFRIPLYIEDRLFIFTDKTINMKYHVICNTNFLVEWNTINNYINELYYYIKRGEL